MPRPDSTAAQPAQFTLPFTHYAKLGYSPCPTDGKIPCHGTGWYDYQYDADELTALDASGHNVGLRCSNVVGIDIDIEGAVLAQRVERTVRKSLGLPKSTPRRIGKAPKALLICRVEQPTKGFDIKALVDGKSVTLFQLLGAGKQFVIHGTHPDTHKPYALDRPLPKWSKLPLVTPEALEKMHADVHALLAAEGYALRSTGATGATGTGKWTDLHPWTSTGLKQADAALAELDPDMSMDEWAMVGFAIYDGTHGSIEGLNLWDQWSSEGEKYKEGDCARRWRGFKPGGGVTKATLFKNNFPKRGVAPRDEPAVVPTADASEFFTTSQQLLGARFERRRQFVDQTIQIGATLLHGPAKKGKSWWLLDMADHVAHGKASFLERPVTGGRVLLIGAEDTAQRFRSRLDVMRIGGSSELILMDREQLKSWGAKYQPSIDDELVPWTPALLIETLYRQTGASVIALDTQEVVEIELQIEHGEKGASLTRQHYMSSSAYDEVAQRLGVAVILVAHWGVIKSLPMAVTSPHEMINTTKTKLAGAIASITVGPLANQELDDDSGRVQLSIMGKDITTGNRYECIERDQHSQRHKYLGAARDVLLRESLADLMNALEGLLKEKGPGSKVTSKELAEALGMRADTVRSKVQAIQNNAHRQAKRTGMADARVFWKQSVLMSSHAGYWLEAT